VVSTLTSVNVVKPEPSEIVSAAKTFHEDEYDLELRERQAESLVHSFRELQCKCSAALVSAGSQYLVEVYSFPST